MNNLVAVTQYLLRKGVIGSSVLWKASGNKAGEMAKTQKASKANLWRKLVFLVAFPAVAGVMGFVFVNKLKEPEQERPEFKPYEHLRRRTKRFPWGDGQRSLFHNPKVNPLPDGYEEEAEEMSVTEKSIAEEDENVEEEEADKEEKDSK